ncbi:MAG: orotate phosphoribosyltransferase [Verrucomicrobia bacterium]|nr:orotate phosphoribosyltransferase [Verrucomicrobiota bacterium]
MAVDVRSVLKDAGAWLEGHFLLHSGRHSDQFIQMAQAFQYPDKVGVLCAELAGKLRPYGPRVVVGPAVGGILMAYAIGQTLGIRALYTEKQDGLHRLSRGFRIEPGEPVAVVDDVSTTGDSVRQAMAAVREAGGAVVAAGLIIDRSGGAVTFDVPFVSLATVKMSTWSPAECPLCARKAPLIDPDTRQPVVT